jgi:hypothetical protein
MEVEHIERLPDRQRSTRPRDVATTVARTVICDELNLDDRPVARLAQRAREFQRHVTHRAQFRVAHALDTPPSLP